MPASPDFVMVVTPVNGEPFEFMYSSQFSAPIGGLWSLELKEALWSLTHTSSALDIIYLLDDKVAGVEHGSVIPPHEGSTSSRLLTAQMRLTPERGLTLYLKLRSTQTGALMEDEQPLHYGQAAIYKSNGPGKFIVLLQNP